MLKIFFLNAVLVIMSGCAVAPFNSPTTARSLGQGNSEINFGLSPALFISGSMGLLEHFDVGASVELQFGIVGSAFAKYSFIDNPDRSSLALYAGIFAADAVANSKGFMIGPVYSYLSNSFEPYLGMYFNYVDFEKIDPNDNDIEDLNDVVDEVVALNSGGSTYYLDTTVGFNYWISEKTKFYLYAKNLYFMEYSFSDHNVWLVGTGLGFKMGSNL